MTLARTILKTAAIGAALMTSTSAFAQWAGTWTVNGKDTGLIQSDDFVTGQMRGGGIIRGVLSPDKKILRGVFSRGSTKQTIELRLNGNEKFTGGIVSFNGGYPIAQTRNVRWFGQLKRQSSPIRANNSSRDAFLNEQSSRVQSWIRTVTNMRGPATVSGERPNAASQAPAAAANVGLQGSWNITIQGTEYGPFADRRQAFAFSAPDRNGVVTGTSMGRNNVIFIGRMQGGRSGKFHGVWMEKGRRGQATGRWGLMEARTGGQPASSMQVFFSIGYRKPQKAYTGRVPGQPGMEAKGPRITSEKVATPPVSQAQAAWRSLLRKNSPFPGIHGIWPTSEIDAAIQPWIRGETQSARFGGNQLVDPCVAKCMGKEPTQFRATLIDIHGDKAFEAATEWAGVGSAAVSIVDANNKVTQRYSARKFFDISRDAAIKDWRDRGVQPPPRTEEYLYPCFISRSTQRDRSTRISFVAGTWSDPLLDLKISTQFKLIEVGSIPARDQVYFGASSSLGQAPNSGFKQALSEARQIGRVLDRKDFDFDSHCINTRWYVKRADGKVKRYDDVAPVVRFEAVVP